MAFCVFVTRMSVMKVCHVVEIVTPKRFLLKGLWFGPKKPKRAIVWIHGLSGSVFSNIRYLMKILDGKTAVLTFNNRGHDIVSGVRRANGAFGLFGGEVHEVFTDCLDDIEGAVRFTRRSRAKDIFVGGSSTGSQKTVYWASRTKSLRNIRGLILAVPLSDYASTVHLRGRAKTAHAVKIARMLVRKGKRRQLLPQGLWHQPFDAQRFVSLYSGEGAEEIFTYWDSKRQPKTLRKITKSVLVLLAGKDEYSDRPAKEIAAWFEKHLRSGKVVIVPHVKHSFRGAEKQVARTIRQWMK